MSNPVIEAIKSRRSCRKFKPDPVPRELIEQVAEALPAGAPRKPGRIVWA